MPTDTTNDAIDNITAQLESLELTQQHELDALLAQHRQQKQALLRRARATKRSTKTSPKAKLPVLSYNKFPLNRGDKVFVRTTATIGTKGDLATVLCVSENRVDIHVHCINDTTWRKPTNLTHYTSVS